MSDPLLPARMLAFAAAHGAPLPVDGRTAPSWLFEPLGVVNSHDGLTRLLQVPPPSGVSFTLRWVGRCDLSSLALVGYRSFVFDALADGGQVSRLVVPRVRLTVNGGGVSDMVAYPVDGVLARVFLRDRADV